MKDARQKPNAPDADARRKQALSSLRPPTRQGGDDQALANTLFRALDAAAHDEADVLTHGFHSYPARLHPSIASVIFDGLAERGNTVVDPFCGSGTTLVEARIRRLPSLGVDLNPVALRVAEVKTDVRTRGSREQFRLAIDEIAERSRERVKARAEARAPLTPEQVKRFDGHVLRELAGIWEEIRRVENEPDRRALQVVLSAILVKVSKQRADTDSRDVPERKIGRYIPTDLFEAKGHELVERWEALANAAAPNGEPPHLVLDDARNLAGIVGDRKADIILTSPPYAGTYDYASHHALREPWLGVKASRLAAQEIGARRSFVKAGAADRWDREILDVLRAISDSLAPGGTAILVVGDGEVGGKRVPADEQLTRLASQAKLTVVATASAPRTDWRRGPDREEHLVALRALRGR